MSFFGPAPFFGTTGARDAIKHLFTGIADFERFRKRLVEPEV
jgi:hypothetical protein